MTPGTDELRRLGALIESSAFVPHLSGMRNLKLWWEAGGGKWADADLEQALAIADLGYGHRPQGEDLLAGHAPTARARRVLLGKPEVLVLDEPTNGLDPGEMREVRQLVRRVAEAGSTVLFSSHVLAEVEQICTPCGRDGQGQVGRDRLGRRPHRSGRDGLPRGRRRRPARPGCSKSIPSVRRIEDEAPGLAVTMEGGRRSDLVAALVAAGIAVETVTARRRLEDAFLGLVEGV